MIICLKLALYFDYFSCLTIIVTLAAASLIFQARQEAGETINTGWVTHAAGSLLHRHRNCNHHQNHRGCFLQKEIVQFERITVDGQEEKSRQ